MKLEKITIDDLYLSGFEINLAIKSIKNKIVTTNFDKTVRHYLIIL